MYLNFGDSLSQSKYEHTASTSSCWGISRASADSHVCGLRFPIRAERCVHLRSVSSFERAEQTRNTRPDETHVSPAERLALWTSC